MVIKSYIVYPVEGRLSELRNSLENMAGCDVVPATNRELLVLVTEAADERSDEALSAELHGLPTIQTLTLVSGHNENPSGKRPPKRAAF